MALRTAWEFNGVTEVSIESGVDGMALRTTWKFKGQYQISTVADSIVLGTACEFKLVETTSALN